MFRKRPFFSLRYDSSVPARLRRLHFRVVVIVFAGLGFFVGMWAVLLADLANALALSPALLGVALSCFSSSGIVALVCGSYLAERLSRRTILLIGIAGVGCFLLVLSSVMHVAVLLIVLIGGGVCTSGYDLAVNTLGGDYERRYQRKAMAIFHAGFNGGAAAGAFLSALALSEGLGFRAIYIVSGVLFVLLAILALWCPLPASSPVADGQTETQKAHEQEAAPTGVGLLLTPLVLLAVMLVCLSFFTDGALEGYISIYLRDLLGSGVLLGGAGIAAYYMTGFFGRLGSAAAIRRYGERRVISAAGMLTLLGMALALATSYAPVAAAGLLLVGIGQSPTVPTAFSLAAQVGARRGANAVALVTASGYTVFLITPLLIGALATLFSLRLALLSTLVASLAIVLVAQRLPGTASERT